jgi:hypothetical protein
MQAMGLSGLVDATASAIRQLRSDNETMQRGTSDANSKRQQAMTSLVSKPTAAEQIISQGLSSRGGIIDVQV